MYTIENQVHKQPSRQAETLEEAAKVTLEMFKAQYGYAARDLNTAQDYYCILGPVEGEDYKDCCCHKVREANPNL